MARVVSRQDVPDPLGGDVLSWDVDGLVHVVSERSGPVAVYTTPQADGILLGLHSWGAVWEVTDKGQLVVRDTLSTRRFTTYEAGQWGWVGHVKSVHHGPGKEFS